MSGTSLYALPVLSIESVPACAVLHRSDCGREVPITGYAWLYRSGETGDGWTLIDTGMSDLSAINAGREKRRQWQSHSLVEALSRHGVSADDVRRVVLTHLHLDHCGSIGCFPKASWHVPALEWQFARDPQNADLATEPLYSRAMLDLMAKHGVELVSNGDCPAPRLRVLHVGGHTPGSIALEILNADDGVKMTLAGDIAPLYDNLKRQIPPGTIWHFGECRRALSRWADAEYPVLPNHDSRLLNEFPYGIILDG